MVSKHHPSKIIEITVNPENISGLATCKYVMRKIGLSENIHKKTRLRHQGKEELYHTYMFSLKQYKGE